MYVRGREPSPSRAQCDLVLRTHNLTSDFSQLMAAANQPSTDLLPQSSSATAVTSAGGGGCNLGMRDLDARSAALIRSAYADDFLMFGYPTATH